MPELQKSYTLKELITTIFTQGSLKNPLSTTHPSGLLRKLDTDTEVGPLQHTASEFLHARCACEEEAVALSREHTTAMLQGVNLPNVEAKLPAATLLRMWSGIFQRLMWEVAYDQFPILTAFGAKKAIRKDGLVVLTEPIKDGSEPVFPTNALSRACMGRIRDSFTCPLQGRSCIALPRAEGEVSLGTLNPTLQNLYVLCLELENARGQLTVAEIGSHPGRLERLEEQINFVCDLFYALAVEAFPAGEDCERIEVRSSWELVGVGRKVTAKK